MIIVTGSNGFIGSNLIKKLNNQGHSNILAVDDLSKTENLSNIEDCEIKDLIDLKQFSTQLIKNDLSTKEIDYVFHQGACSDTTEWDVDYMLKNNFSYSKVLLDFAEQGNIPLKH